MHQVIFQQFFYLQMEIDSFSNNITIDVNGQKMSIDGVSRYTTCDDVIEMVFYNRPVNVDSYAVFESSCGVDRMLYGKESILKVVRSWGAGRSSFTLMVKKVENVKTNMSTLSQVRRKLRKLPSQNVNALPPKQLSNTIQANLNKTGHKLDISDKDIETTYPANEKEKNSKLDLLKRFLNDVMSYKKNEKKLRSTSRMTRRTPGDGCTGSPENQWYKTSESESLSCHISYLNAAFVEGDDMTDSDSETDDKPLDMMDQTSITSENESVFEDDSICELERNIEEMSDIDSGNPSDLEFSDNEGPFCDTETTVIKCERIIDFFRKSEKHGAESETDDDYMKSFMNTVVYDSDSDEGMSSLDSDISS